MLSVVRIVVIMKSRISYERFETDLKEFTVHKHVSSVADIQECVTYWNPDIAILDIQSPIYHEAQKLFFNFDVDVVEFTSDFDSAIEEVKSYSAFYDSQDDLTLSEVQAKEIPDFSDYEIKAREELKKEVVVQIQKEIVEVEKEVEVVAYTNVPPKLIVVASLWSGAGSSFVAANLARSVANRGIQVSYIEYPTVKPYMFDYINLSSLEESEKFQYLDIAKLIERKGAVPKKKGWSYKGVHWILNDPRIPTLKTWKFEHMLRLIYSVNTPITIVDISTEWMHEDMKGLLSQADFIYISVDPDPIKASCLTPFAGNDPSVRGKEERFVEYVKSIEETEKIPYEFILSKMNENINRKELIEVLEKKPFCEFEYIPYPDFIESIWQSEILYDHKTYHNMIENALQPIIKSILPPKYHYLEESSVKRKVPFLSIFGKKKDQ